MKNIQLLLAGACLTAASLGAQTTDTMSQGKMSGAPMTHQQMMDKMSGMSSDEKMQMFDRMSEKDQRAAMKMAGHDMGKMSTSERMDMMAKMSSEDKAMMFDKMPMEKKMAMMKSGATMKGSKNMDKKDPMKM